MILNYDSTGTNNRIKSNGIDSRKRDRKRNRIEGAIGAAVARIAATKKKQKKQ